MTGTTFPDHGYGEHKGDSDQGYRGDSRPSYNQQQYGGGNKGNWQGNKGSWNGNKGNWQGKKPFQRQPDTDLTLYKAYAVSGNKDCPEHIRPILERIVKKLETEGFTMRCRGMDGFEDWAEKATTKHEIHLPWRGFAEKESKFTWTGERATAVAKMFHPTFEGLQKAAQTFLAANARVLMGDKMNSAALFLLCWTEDGVESAKAKTARTGFTGHPIAIASALGIPIFNLGNPGAEDRINFYIESTRDEQSLKEDRSTSTFE